MKVGIVDYGAGNLKSVETALAYIGADYLLSDRPEQLIHTDKLIFPGVGEARAAMAVLERTGLAEMLREYRGSGKPILGICLGCQIVLAFSEERSTVCLDLIPGRVKRFPSNATLKIPHMGWNTVSYKRDHRLFEGIPDQSSFYFVHSYYPVPEESEMILTETDYGLRFPSGICDENLVAFQFHPEKSGRYGLRLLHNFVAG